MSYLTRKQRPRKAPQGFVRRGLGADMVKVAEMSNMTKTSTTAAVPYTTSTMTKLAPTLTTTAPTLSTMAKLTPTLTVAPSMTDSYVAPKPASAYVPYTTSALAPKTAPSLLDTFVAPTQTLSTSTVAPTLAVAAPAPTRSLLPTVQPTYTPSPDYVAPTRSLAPTVQPTPTRIAPTRTLAPTVQPTYTPSPDYAAPVTTSDGPRYPVNVQPVSIIQPVLVPWLDNTKGGGGGGGFRYPEEIPPGLEPTPIVITKPFPWWLVAVGVGAYLYMKKK